MQRGVRDEACVDTAAGGSCGSWGPAKTECCAEKAAARDYDSECLDAVPLCSAMGGKRYKLCCADKRESDIPDESCNRGTGGVACKAMTPGCRGVNTWGEVRAPNKI